MKLQQIIQERLRKVEQMKLAVENPKEALAQSEEHIGQLEEEISELQRRHAELERLSQTDDNLHFLQVRQMTSAHFLVIIKRCRPPVLNAASLLSLQRILHTFASL